VLRGLAGAAARWHVGAEVYEEEQTGGRLFAKEDRADAARIGHVRGCRSHDTQRRARKTFAANTRLSGVLLAPSALHPQSHRLVAHDDMAIEFLALWPLYSEEMEMKRTQGTAALRTAQAREGVTELVDIRRKNVGK